MLTTRTALCHLLLRRQGLLGSRASGGASGAVNWVRQQGFLQLEARTQALAASHDLVLFNRVGGYQAGDLDLALYDDREFFEHYLHVPGALPASDYGLIHDPEAAALASLPGSLGERVLDLLRAEGAASLRELQAHLRREGYADRRAVARAVHALYASGAILVRQREGNQRLFDLANRVLVGRGREALSSEERLWALARRTLRILAPVTRATWSQALGGVGARTKLGLTRMKREKRRLMAELVSCGEAAVVQVEDPPEWYILPSDWLPELERRPSQGAPRVSFLSSSDPVVWDRLRARDLFGFDCRPPAFLPPDRMRLASPLCILYGSTLVGRLDAQMSWSSRRLLVHEVRVEWQGVLEDSHFRASFAAALQELAAFHGSYEVRAAGPVPARLLSP